MNRSLLAGLALACLGGGAADAAEPSLCMQLADKARQLPSAAWAKPEPLAPWLQPSRRSSPRKLSPTEAVLASDARWREQIGAPAGWVVGVDHLAGTPVYLIEHLAGTANCQSLVLVEAEPGQPARELAPPFRLEGMDLCTTQSAQFAQVLGRPALVVGGAPSMISPDRHYRISAWTPQGWGQACQLELRLHSTMAPARRFCAPGAALCDAGQPVAQQLAQAYEADRASKLPLDAERFAAGRQPDAGVLAALNPPLAEPGAVGDFNLPLPLFGADDKGLDAMQTQFSNADPRRLPVFIDGRWWLAVVGRGGVGWREGEAILVALFAPPGRPTDAVAAYQFITGPAGLRDAVARDEQP
ncbi:MAG: hypothetical protein JF607_19265 [Burkholderiales bacterium]|jgi:hypothetical protein|nr:hypothetical protein [Burkholderiales bacterium]